MDLLFCLYQKHITKKLKNKFVYINLRSNKEKKKDIF